MSEKSIDTLQIFAASRILIAKRNIEVLNNTIWEATVNIEAADLAKNQAMRDANTETIRQAIIAIRVWRQKIEEAESESSIPAPNGQMIS